MDSIELAIHVSNTAAFIAARPKVITLTPKTERVRTPGGGYKDSDGIPRTPQTFRVIEQGAESTPPQIKGTDGIERSVEFLLLGLPNAIVEIDDHWIEDGRTYTIDDVVHPNEYETRCIVTERGA